MRYFEEKVFKTIKRYKLVDYGQRVAVAVSGGKDSITALYLMHKFAQEYGQEIIAISVDEGTNYRKEAIKKVKKFCSKYRIEHKVYSFKDEFGYTLPELATIFGKNLCRMCGVIRRYILNKKARELGAEVLVTGHNANDEAQAIMMNLLRGNFWDSARLGPKTGAKVHEKFIPRVKPLYFMLEKEDMIYALLKEFPIQFFPCPFARYAFRGKVKAFLNELEYTNPGTHHKILSGFLEILPLLRKHYEGKIGTCVKCGEPSSAEVCKFCELKEKVDEKSKKEHGD